MPNLNNIFMVDDDLAILDSMQFMLLQYGFNLQIYPSANQFLANSDISQPGCLIVDSKMPEITGQELQQTLVKGKSPLGIIFLTGHGDLPMAVQAFRQGACDFFQKPVKGIELVSAIEKALATSKYTFEAMQLRQRYSTLTERENQVLHLLIDGKTNKKMADILFVSLRTIEVHRSKIIKKLQVRNAAELAKFSPLLVD
ncbi:MULTISPECIES: response regulator transcription factor [Shewanella]|uniref:DNA-binding response regulator n=1 Tax=Shewanella psychromarinicola TaxID=2487742 RepID=A0A3N4E7I9_9GAMM|nr:MULTISPECIES: response regulator [Shewanella]AZG36315.1 DNA-binding response regulator [Shewanella psychromarinicola]MCL1080816.1 response regulator [Shewanella psychromarinicola]PKG77609.1 DNA-binding response regulator [Shewanella sp. Actino-trap-3]RPA34155.1 DNA-binding response regulator [Shewanella psychromarinicola]